MHVQSLDPGWRDWARWMGATLIGWVIGMIGALVLSFAVVNLFYHKETNLIVGLCLGAAVALSQRYAVRRQIELASRWVWGAAVGFGIPFVGIVVLDEMGMQYGNGLTIPLFLLGGAVCGFLQAPALRLGLFGTLQWVLVCILAWGLPWFLTRTVGIVGFLGGGILLGAMSFAGLLWLRRSSVNPATG